MAQVLVREIDSAVVTRLKARARESGRSLQAELKLILERAAASDVATAQVIAARLRRRLAGRDHTDSARLLARDRMR